MDTREMYEFVKRLQECGVGVLETRCWREFDHGDIGVIGFGCGSYFRFMLGLPIVCPFCGTGHVYAPLAKGQTFFEVYPVTPNYTGDWGTLTDDEREKHDKAMAVAGHRKIGGAIN